MTGETPAVGNPRRRGLIGLLGVAVVVLVIVVAWHFGTLPQTSVVVATSSPGPLATLPVAEASPTTSPTVAPPTPAPTPVLVPAPLTGLLVTEAAARQHVIAVMVDDHVDARPQSGFNAASMVWQAPAEGGIPRYMLIFQDTIPTSVGPIRSSREYYIEWAAAWDAMYVHFGGSSQALATLRAEGGGQWVYNADGFRWSPTYMWRIKERFAPHNVYTDGAHLRELAARVGAADGAIAPTWTFGTDVPGASRPTGGTIRVDYPYESVLYRYDRSTNSYLRFVRAPTGGPFKAQVDHADGKQVAPKNVVILRMFFGPLYAVDPHHRLEAADIGHGEAWIATGGHTVKGTWKKASATAPLLLFGPNGMPITLTAGQTFVQVLTLGYTFKITDGTVPPFIVPRQLVAP